MHSFYKKRIFSDPIITKYGKFYNNTEVDRRFDESNNLEDPDDKDIISQCNNPYDDINSIINFFSDENYDPFPFFISLSKTIKSNDNDIDSIIVETNFIPFLSHKIVEIPPDLYNVKVQIARLIHTILNECKSLHIVFFNEGLVPILSDIIRNEKDPRLLTYSIFSFNHLFKTFECTNLSYFEDYISIAILRDSYKRIMQHEATKFTIQFLKGAIVLSSRISYYQLDDDDSMAAFELSLWTLVQEKDDIYVYALKTLSYLFENGKINFEDFDQSGMYKIVKKRFFSSYPSNKIFSCDIFVSLFKNGYFANYYFDIEINQILNCIDENEESEKCQSAYFRLLSAIFRYTYLDDDYIIQIFGTNPNENGLRTICHYLLKGNYELLISSAHCFIELFFKITDSNDEEMLSILYNCLEEETIKSIVKIIEVAKDGDDEELLFSGLQIFYRTLVYSKENDIYPQVQEFFMKADVSELLLEFDQLTFENDQILEIIKDIKQIFNSDFEE